MVRRWHAGKVMTSRTGYGRTVLLILAAGVSLASMPAKAQTAPATEDPDTPAMEDPAMEADAAATTDDADIKELVDWILALKK